MELGDCFQVANPQWTGHIVDGNRALREHGLTGCLAQRDVAERPGVSIQQSDIRGNPRHFRVLLDSPVDPEAIASLEVVQDRDLDSENYTDVVVPVLCCSQRTECADQCRSLIFTVDNVHDIRTGDPADIDDRELLLRKFFCCGSECIPKQEPDADDEIELTSASHVAQVGQVIRRCCALDLDHLVSEVLRCLIRPLEAHVVEREVPSSANVQHYCNFPFCQADHSDQGDP